MWNKPALIFAPLRTPDGPLGMFSPWQMESHKRHAEHLARIAWVAGYATVCPHKNTEHFDGVPGLTAESFIRGDYTFARSFAPQGGIAIMGKGWEDSEGSRAERDVALECGLGVIPFSTFSYDDRRLFWYLRTRYANEAAAPEFMEAMADPKADPEATAKKLGTLGAVG